MSTPGRFPLKNTCQSPFDNGKLGKLIFSPGVFNRKRCESESSTSQEFRWSIEEQCFMAPAIINPNETVEDERNENVEAMVKKYFEQEHFVPSPDVVASNKTLSRMVFTPLRSAKKMTEYRTAQKEDKEVQTDINIPLDFDLQGLIQGHLVQRKRPNDNSISDVSFNIDLDATESNLNSSESKLQRLSVDSTTSDIRAPLGEIADDIFVEREALNLSPIKL